MVTQMLLLRFQMCAVVNHLRHRKSRMPRVANPECRDPSHGRPKSVGDNIAHLHIRRRHHDRPSTRIEMRHRQNAVLLRHRLRKSGMPCVVTITEERNLSEATLHIHASAGAATIDIQLASKRDIAKAIQGPNSAPGDCFFQIPNIRCYRSSSRYQVTPHRMSCPCLVSFSVGHYDVLVSTPDSMFSVV